MDTCANCANELTKRQWKVHCQTCRRGYHTAKAFKCVRLPILNTNEWICDNCSLSSDLLQLPLFPDAHQTPPTPDEEACKIIAEEWKHIKSAKGIKICHTNINGIRNKLDDDFQDFLIFTNVHVLAVSETKLDPDRDTDNQIQVLYKGGGGLLFYIRNDIQFEVLDMTVKTTEMIEYLIVKVNFKGISPIVICAIYSPPKVKKETFIDFFKDLNLLVAQLGLEYVLVGDLNIDLLKNLNSFDINAHKLLQVAKEFNL